MAKNITLNKLTINKPFDWDVCHVQIEITNYDNDYTKLSIDDIKVMRDFLNEILEESQCDIGVNNFDNFTFDEYQTILRKLKINKFSELLGTKVYYNRNSNGVYTVRKWDQNKSEYTLTKEGETIITNPFKISLTPFDEYDDLPF